MNYDSIIVEMLSRIQALEEEVNRLKAALGAQDGGDAAAKVTTADIREYIEKRKAAARQDGDASLTLRASEIHGALKLGSRYPMVCNAMRQCMGPGDAVVHETASGYSSSLEIRYSL